MTRTVRKSPTNGERVQRGQSSLAVYVLLFAGLAPSLLLTRVVGEHEPWTFWDYVAHVAVLTLAPAVVIGLIRLVEKRIRRMLARRSTNDRVN